MHGAISREVIHAATLSSRDDARLIVRNDAQSAIDPEALKQLAALSLGSAVVTIYALPFAARKR